MRSRVHVICEHECGHMTADGGRALYELRAWLTIVLCGCGGSGDGSG